MVELIHGLRPEDVRANLDAVRARLAAAGCDPDRIQILAAVKYLPAESLQALVDGGVTLAGENRAQELVAKAQTAAGAKLSWDFIGTLQSRRVPLILPRVRYIHSVASASALAQIARHATDTTAKLLIEVNVSGEPGKAGITPDELPRYLEDAALPVVGLMTMPPQTTDPERSRRHFAALRELARRHNLPELSMGTTQDYVVAAQEGATIIRLGSVLFMQRAA